MLLQEHCDGFPCSVCQHRVSSVKELGSHTRNMHPDFPTYNCTARFCHDTAFVNVHTFEKHCFNEHSRVHPASRSPSPPQTPLQQQLPQTDASLILGQMLRQNIDRSGSAVTRHKCQFCHELFPSAESLNEHMCSKCNIKCAVCHAVFSSKEDLKQHIDSWHKADCPHCHVDMVSHS